MITVNGWCAGGKGGVSVQSIGEMGKDFRLHIFSNLFLKTLAEGAVTTEAGSLFQYFTNLVSEQ